jgi:hypothetical protein
MLTLTLVNVSSPKPPQQVTLSRERVRGESLLGDLANLATTLFTFYIQGTARTLSLERERRQESVALSRERERAYFRPKKIHKRF